MSEPLITENDNHTYINLYKFATILDIIEDESDEMYASARILKKKATRGRKALDEKDYEEINRIFYELKDFIKNIGI